MAASKRILWVGGKDFIRGSVDGLQMFALYGTASSGWRVVTNLPGLPMLQSPAPQTIDEAKDSAAGILARWLDRIVEAGP